MFPPAYGEREELRAAINRVSKDLRLLFVNAGKGGLTEGTESCPITSLYTGYDQGPWEGGTMHFLCGGEAY